MQVAAVFSNHCVLQRNKIINIFGYAENKIKIQVTLCDAKDKILCSNHSFAADGKWIVNLTPQSAQSGCSLKIQASDCTSITFTDISIGEVWLAGGQSNMEFELGNCTEGPAELSDEKEPNVRFYYTNKIGWKDKHFYEAEKATAWQTWDSQWKNAWSAVGYFFAKKLAADLGVTVGVIGCNWGGTSASAWMRREYLEKDIDLRTYLTEQDEATAGKSIEQQCKEYDDYEKENNLWQEKCAKIYQKNPQTEWADVEKELGKCPWPGPKSCKNPYRPTGLYDCMLSRIIPYTIQGVIWYQGESDDHKPAMYYKLFSSMIDNWRTDWNNPELPFIFVQLVNHRYKQDKDFKHWCYIREAQEKVHNTVKNTWMTCGFDLGTFNDIHPKHKKALAERMEANALYNVYSKGEKSKALCPTFKSALPMEDGSMILTFNNADDGFNYSDDSKTLEEYRQLEKIQGNTISDDFTGFELAGANGIYYSAKYEFGSILKQKNTITLKCDKVPCPVYARYAWYNYGPITIYNNHGQPLAPFRISPSDTTATTEHAKIQQIMTV